MSDLPRCEAHVWESTGWGYHEQCPNKGKYDVEGIEYLPFGRASGEAPRRKTLHLCGTHKNFLNRGYRSISIGTGEKSDDWRHDEVTVQYRKAPEGMEDE